MTTNLEAPMILLRRHRRTSSVLQPRRAPNALLLAALTLACLLAWPFAHAGIARALDDSGPGSASRDGNEGWVKPLPDWSIQPELNALDGNVRKFNHLIENLGHANEDLKSSLDSYMDDPQNELLASDVERKLALHARQVVRNFDDILSDQDVLIANFKGLQRKLGKFTGQVNEKIAASKNQFQSAQLKVQVQERELVKLAVQIRESPPTNPTEMSQLKREFARHYSLFRLQNRYLKGFEIHYRNREKLVQNLEQLQNIFGLLQDKFVDLVANLENERNYLHESIALQVDTLRIKELIRDGITHGRQSIANVTEKLASSFVQVDAFTKVHERINQNLNVFVESQEALLSVSDKIGSIGEFGGEFGNLGNDLEEVIKHFADLESGPKEQEE